MYERLLVPLDGSVLSEAALPYAEELAGRLNSEVTLVYVAESEQDPLRHMHELYLDKMCDAIERAAARFIEKRRKSVKVKTALMAGDAAEKIIEFADKEDTGLIIMSTHGRSGIKLWALGSVADKVIRATERPVLLIRAGDDTAGLREKGVLSRVLVPLDGSKEGESALGYVQEMALKLQAEVILFQAIAAGRPEITADGYIYLKYNEQQTESDKTLVMKYLQKTGRRLEKLGLNVSVAVSFGEAAEEIIKAADETKADLVAMSTHGRSGAARWVFGSVAEKVLREGKTPILMVRAPENGGQAQGRKTRAAKPR